MKKTYIRPAAEWVSICPDQPIAAPCWANAGKKPMYHDVPGYGSCQVTLSNSGCGKATVIAVSFPDSLGMTSQQKAQAEAWMMNHIAEKMAAAGNNMASFKGSEFANSPDPSWS